MSIKTSFLICTFYSATAVLGSITTSSGNPSLSINTVDPIEVYFKNFETLSKSENWKEIIAQGNKAIEFSNCTQQEYKFSLFLSFHKLSEPIFRLRNKRRFLKS